MAATPEAPHAGRPRGAAAWGLVLALLASPAAAQQVSLGGTFGGRSALLIINGQPRTVAVGAAVQGVKLLSLNADEAEVEVDGRRLLLRSGAAPLALGGRGGGASGREIVLTAGPGGHFLASGSINNKAVQFMVDTGATSVALGQADAERIGLDFRSGTPMTVQTANGPAPAYLVTLSSVRIGDVEVTAVQAAVMPSSMPYVLLGNSFLTRFQMRRENDVMRLERR